MGSALCNWGLPYWPKIFWTFGTVVTLSPSFANELVKYVLFSKQHHDGSKFLSQIEGHCWCQVLQHWAKIKQFTSFSCKVWYATPSCLSGMTDMMVCISLLGHKMTCTWHAWDTWRYASRSHLECYEHQKGHLPLFINISCQMHTW
jgi:hypothetical protein